MVEPQRELRALCSCDRRGPTGNGGAFAITGLTAACVVGVVGQYGRSSLALPSRHSVAKVFMISRSDRCLSVLSPEVAREETFRYSTIDGSGVGSWSAGYGEFFARSSAKRTGGC